MVPPKRVEAQRACTREAGAHAELAATGHRTLACSPLLALSSRARLLFGAVRQPRVLVAPRFGVPMEAEPTQLSALPPVLVQRILALLPVDARARAATVCRSWRDALADARLWAQLDLSDTSGVTCRVDDKVLRGAAARAGGALQTLDLRRADDAIYDAALVVQANKETLRELRVGSCSRAECDTLTPLLVAAPELRVLSADVCCSLEKAPALLRNEPPYGPLRLNSLVVLRPWSHNNFSEYYFPTPPDEDLVWELAAALPAHASLRRLEIMCTKLMSDVACDALVDALLDVRLPSLWLTNCRTSAAAASALALLLAGDSLTELRLGDCQGLLYDAPSVAMLAAALHANATLTSLHFADMALWRGLPCPGAVLLGALTGHPSLQKLVFRREPMSGTAVAAGGGDAFGVLVAANASALTELVVSDCQMCDEALGPLCDALPRNTHLCILDVSYNGFSAAFASERLLPAVRANTSLRRLRATSRPEMPALVEAMNLVSSRATEATEAQDR